MADLHIVFDLDDTLYPERDYAIGGFRAASAWAQQTFGVRDITDDLVRHLDDGHLGRSFALALAAVVPEHTPDDLKGMFVAYAGHQPSLKLFDDAAAALQRYRGRTLGMITDGHAKTQAAKVAALDVGAHFSEIVYTGALGPDRAFHKPHPRAFEMIEERLRRAPDDRFVYIGDNPAKDFIAPNARGWATVLVDRPHHRALRIHPLVDAPDGGVPQAVIATLDALPDVIGV